MISNVSFSNFVDGFGQGSYKDCFSYDGKRALFDYLEEYEQSTDEQIEFDPIALCCEFSEYDNLADFNDQTGSEFDNLEQLEDKTTIIRFGSDSFLAMCY